MKKIAIIIDQTLDKLKTENLFKDASNVSLYFITDHLESNVVDMGQLTINQGPKVYLDTISNLYQAGYEHIMILTSSKYLTKSYELAVLASDILKSIKVDIIDTNTFGPGISYLVMCICYWARQGLNYKRIQVLLDQQIQNNITFIYTNTYKHSTDNIFKKLLKSFVKGMVVSSGQAYKGHDVIYNERKVFDCFYRKIQGSKTLNPNIQLFIFGGTNQSQAKLLQHELYKLDKSLSVQQYGHIKNEITNHFGDDMYGIYIGYYEEMTV
jgi:hypothetical protein